MRKTRKLTNPESEMTRLKLLWKQSLPEADRDYWREQFASARTQAELRQELAAKYGINLIQQSVFIIGADHRLLFFNFAFPIFN
jgi:hypothetical protein